MEEKLTGNGHAVTTECGGWHVGNQEDKDKGADKRSNTRGRSRLCRRGKVNMANQEKRRVRNTEQDGTGL